MLRFILCQTAFYVKRLRILKTIKRKIRLYAYGNNKGLYNICHTARCHKAHGQKTDWRNGAFRTYDNACHSRPCVHPHVGQIHTADIRHNIDTVSVRDTPDNSFAFEEEQKISKRIKRQASHRDRQKRHMP